MSRIYDNWERLVAAVLKRVEFRQLCYCDSLDSSIGSTPSDLSPGSSSRFNDNLNFTESEDQTFAHRIEDYTAEQYEPGVYIRLAVRGDGTKHITGVKISRRRFSEKDARTWWLNNRERVYKKYNDVARLASIRLQAVPDCDGPPSKEPFLNEREERTLPKESSDLISLETRKCPLMKTPLEDYKGSKYSDVQGTVSHIADEWIEEYLPGVYITIAALQDGCREVRRAQFSRTKFKEQEAETWWLDNQDRVIEKHNQRTGASLAKESSSNRVPSGIKEPVSTESYGNKTDSNPDELLVAQGRNEEPMLETNLNEVFASGNLNEPFAHPHGEMYGWVEKYEPGVYVTWVYNEDGTKYVENVRFRKKLELHEAEAWWAKNREKVYERYNGTVG